MRIVIDDKMCEKHGLKKELLFTILLLSTGTDFKENIQKLLNRAIIDREVKDFKETYYLTSKGSNIISSVLLDSEKEDIEKFEDRLDVLTKNLQEIFPTGKKEGTNIYWRGNISDIKLRLKKFFKRYGNTYTDEQILQAASEYVSSFNGNYSFMRILKYFIIKDEKKVDAEGNGYAEIVSDLASCIENAGQVNENTNWTNNIR